MSFPRENGMAWPRIAKPRPSQATPPLLEVQRAIARSVLHHEDGDAGDYVLADGLAAERRLCIYRNTFVSNLTHALRLAFPAVHRLVGSEFFTATAHTFVHEQPPRGACLDEYGAEFPGFLAFYPPAASVAYLYDVARLEWSVSRALHAPDVAALDVERLAAIEEADHGRVSFVTHPSVGLVAAEHPADAVWRAVLAHDDPALAAIDPEAGPVFLLVQRSASGVEVVRLEEDAWQLTRELISGRPLGAALERWVDMDASALLAAHLHAGRFIDFHVTETSLPYRPKW